MYFYKESNVMWHCLSQSEYTVRFVIQTVQFHNMDETKHEQAFSSIKIFCTFFHVISTAI